MYQVDQYNSADQIPDCVNYLNSGTNSCSALRINSSTTGLMSNSYFDFEDECLRYNRSPFYSNQCYYLKCYIKRIYNEQKFDIKLKKYDDPNPTVKKEQYIKTIEIPRWERNKNNTSWVNQWDCVELFFNPAKDNFFDTIVFELYRSATEFTGLRTYPKIIYTELAEFLNLPFVASKEIIKFGLQARPNFLFCLNDEEMRVSSNGIYELRNTAVPISFISVPKNVSSDNVAGLQNTEDEINIAFLAGYKKYSENNNKEQAMEALSAIQSDMITSPNSRGTYDPFIIDYIYRVEGGSENA